MAAVRDWADTARPDLPPLAGDFLAAAVQREHDEQRATRRRTRRLRQLVAGLGVMLLLAVTTTVFAVQARNEAVHGRNEGISRKVAGAAIALRTTDPALAAQLSLAAFRLAPTAEAYGALISSLVTPNPTHLTIGTDTGAVRSTTFSPTGGILATGGHDNASHLWDVTDSLNLGDLAVLSGHTDAVRSVAFHPAGNVLATSSSDRQAKLWDVSDRHHPRELATLSHQAGVSGVAFRPDGNILATASSDTTVGLWDITDPSRPGQLPPLAGHTAPVYGLAFSPDGHTLATASVDTTVRLWNVTDPLLPSVLATPLVGHTDNVYSVAFSPDRHTLVTASHDKTVRLWETDPDRIAARICASTRTVITQAEWDYYFPGLPYRPPCPWPVGPVQTAPPETRVAYRPI